MSDQCPDCLLGLGLLDTPSEITNGSQFGEYVLGRQLGRGAMGVVYEAVQVNLGRTVALKMILGANLAEPTARRRFRIEAEAAAKLQHPNIVPLYDFGECDEQPFLSMQFVAGETLKAKIRRGDLSLANGQGDAQAVARFMGKVARAVAHAHSHGVLHRDIKPANILVDPEGEPHLTDFGLAKILEAPDKVQASATISGGVVGTPSYMAPELARGGASSTATDIYSLGAVLYEMLTGLPPFKSSTALETIRHASEDEPRKPRVLVKGVPTDLETICLKCLNKNPGARYSSAEAVAEDLDRWLQAKPIHARPAGPLLRLGRWSKRNPVGITLILALCVALISSLVVLGSMRQQELAARNSQMWQNLLYAEYEQNIRDMWKNPNEEFVEFTNVYLAALSGQPPAPANSVVLTFGMEMTGDPIHQAFVLAPVLQCIQARMEKILRRPVSFNLLLQKHRPDVAAPTISQRIDFQRLGPVAYIRAKDAVPGLVLLAQERGSKDGVIFARRDVAEKYVLTNLAGIKGKGLRVALAHTNSILSFEAERQMALGGITSKDLSMFKHLNPPRAMAAEDSADQPMDPAESQFAHAVVIDQVISNLFDVGEAPWHHFQVLGRGRLVELLRFAIPPRVYIARPGVDPVLAAAFRDSLLGLKGRNEIKALQRFLNDPAAGFQPVSEADLNEIRSALTNEIRRFEARD